MSLWLAALFVGLMLCPLACRPSELGPLDDLPPLAGLEADPARLPGPTPTPVEVGLAHILVTYKGSFEPVVGPKFSVGQARARAEHLLALARAKGQPFDALAKRYSDDTATSQDGGRLGVYSRSELHPDVERAAFSLGLGQVADLIHTPHGFHVLMRVEPFEAQVSEIVIAYTGAKKYSPREPRSREQAAALARQVHERIQAGGHFADEAFAHSDQSTWVFGGFLPIFERGTQHPQFEEIVWNLSVGQMSEVHETATGFHILARWPVERIRTRKATFTFLVEGVEQPAIPMPTRQEALAQAEAFASRLREPGADFVALVSEVFGDDLEQGKRSGWLDRQAPYPLGKQAFALEIGEVAGPFLVKSSYVVIERVP